MSGRSKTKKPINILMVEDNEIDAKIALRAFRNGKFNDNIYVVKDGQDALDFIYQKGVYEDKEKFPRPDLILLDINMPRLNGFQVLEKLKNDPDHSSIPIVMLTSSKEEEDILKSYGKGAVGYLQKPVRYEEFVEILNGFSLYWHEVSELPHTK